MQPKSTIQSKPANMGAPGLASKTWDKFSLSHSSLLQQDAQLIQIVDANLADAARRSGEHLVCRPGCTQCCYGAFAISPLDAIRLRTAMAELAVNQPAQAAEIAERARLYLAEFAPSFPGNPTTGILDDNPEAQVAFDDFANNAPCPALNPANGLCDLYTARPMTCRVFGPPVRASSELQENQTPDNQVPENEVPEEAFAVCELCFTNATPEEIAAAEMTVPRTEEQDLLNQLAQLNQLGPNLGETIVAYCLDLTSLPPAARP
jgi:Fe-S-cluster containining protein